MANLTVGEIAGMLNGIIIFVQITLPMLVIAILASVLPDMNSALTWSSVNRFIQNSWWPTIMRTDSAKMRGVRFRVQVLSILINFGLVSLLIANIVTPLGLDTAIRPAQARRVNFQYATDASSFGLATPPRPENPFSRYCSYSRQCPGSYEEYSMEIPNQVTDMFSASSELGTVSGPFDIQYRQWAPAQRNGFHEDKPYVMGHIRSIDTLVSRGGFLAVDGVVVDMHSGGLGYRKHTAPEGADLGATWNEDLLWIQPVTTCVDTNFSLHFTTQNDTGSSSGKYTNAFIRDNGGFSDLPTNISYSDDWDSEFRPDLFRSASNAAILNNGATMTILGILDTNSSATDRPTPGLEYKIELWNSSSGNGYYPADESLIIGDILGDYLSDADEADFLGIGDYICAGYDEDSLLYDLGEIRPHVRCGYIYGVPYRSDGSDGLIAEPGVDYQQNLYVCASAVKAMVKTAQFSVQGGSNLEALTVIGVTKKRYKREEDYPIWAFETPLYESTVKSFRPLWGIVAKELPNATDYTFQRAEEFYLPADWRNHFLEQTVDSLAVANVFGAAFNNIYTDSARVAGVSTSITYSGGNNFAMLQKWKTLSKTSTGAAAIINLIYTDMLASATVGTKSLLSTGDSGAEVSIRETKITYNLKFAIPGLIVLGFWFMSLLASAILFGFGSVTLHEISHLTNNLSPGRICVNHDLQHLSQASASTREWTRDAGSALLRLDNDGLRAARTVP